MILIHLLSTTNASVNDLAVFLVNVLVSVCRVFLDVVGRLDFLHAGLFLIWNHVIGVLLLFLRNTCFFSLDFDTILIMMRYCSMFLQMFFMITFWQVNSIIGAVLIFICFCLTSFLWGWSSSRAVCSVSCCLWVKFSWITRCSLLNIDGE